MCRKQPARANSLYIEKLNESLKTNVRLTTCAIFATHDLSTVRGRRFELKAFSLPYTRLRAWSNWWLGT